MVQGSRVGPTAPSLKKAVPCFEKKPLMVHNRINVNNSIAANIGVNDFSCQVPAFSIGQLGSKQRPGN